MDKHTFNLDMDGVVADFLAGAEKVVGYRINDPGQLYPDADWDKLRAHVRMFRDLPLMKGANEFVKIARSFRDDLDYELVFLSAIPHYNDVHWAFWDKMLWVQDHFPDIPVHFGPYSVDKPMHCKPGDILVDDRIDNCDAWEKVGGISVFVPYGNYKVAVNTLSAMLEKKLAIKKASAIYAV